ncbi:hypothetical protein [Phytoactinopolyspora halophila]|nr:hypothetical protein [Phytoactinopolyspora halophila]
MKTTVDLSDVLLREAQETAQRKNTTLKALIESGLRKVLAEQSERSQFTLQDASVDGRGLQDEFRNAGWEKVRDTIYERTT